MSLATAVRELPDDQLAEKIGDATLEALEGVFVEDVLAYTDQGLASLPTYDELYRRAVRQQWSPYDVDFARDKEEWDSLSEETKERRLFTLRLFLGGEERVASLLTPLVWAAPSRPVANFLATQLNDEIRHTVFFDRFWREVIDESASDIDTLVMEVQPTENRNYEYMFFEWLPAVSQRLASNPDDLDASAEFVTLYHLVTEGTLFLTGMRFQLEGARRWGRTWGFYQGFTASTRDESRHVLFGVRYLRDLIAQDKHRFAPVIRGTVEKCIPVIEGHLSPLNGDYSPYGGTHMADAWGGGYTPERMQQEVLAYAMKILGRRLNAAGIRMNLAPARA